jgi:hypothetical protein
MDCKADILFALPRIFSDIAHQHSTAASKAQATKRRHRVAYRVLRIGLHILPDGMCSRAIPSDSLCAQDQTKETGLAFRSLMR